MVRQVLGALYGASSVLAALALASIAIIVLLQIVSRTVGIRVIGLDDFAAWSMAAAVFLALPDTLAKGGHIRVLLFIQRLPTRIRLAIDVLTASIGLAVALWAARSVILFVWSSYQLGDVTQGELVLPLWLPQLSVAIGFALLAVAFAEHAFDAVKFLIEGRDGQSDDPDNVGREGF